MLGIISHDTKKHRRDQIFEDGFDFTLAATRKEMAKQQGGFDKTKVGGATPTAWHEMGTVSGIGRGCLPRVVGWLGYVERWLVDQSDMEAEHDRTRQTWPLRSAQVDQSSAFLRISTPGQSCVRCSSALAKRPRK